MRRPILRLEQDEGIDGVGCFVTWFCYLCKLRPTFLTSCSKSVITTTQLSSSFRLHSHSENRHFKFYSTPVVVPKMGGSHLDSVPSWMLSFIQTRSFIRLFLPSPVTNTAPSNIIISSLLYLRTLHLRCKILGFCCDIFSYKF